MTRYLLILALTLSVAVASAAAAAQGRAAITTAQIAAAISGAGMNISAEQVTLLSDVVAANGSPELKVQSMEPWGDGRIRVRLDCATHEECMPFIVAVRSSQPIPMKPASAATERSAAAIVRAGSGQGSVAMRAGAPATLLLDKGHVHIRLTVVCLENGTPGQTIRVASKDHKQTYIGKVIDDAVLIGSL
jgi:hypothetical protein